MKLKKTTRIISIIIIAAFFVIVLFSGVVELSGTGKELLKGEINYKKEAATLKNMVSFRLFKVSANSQVISGKNGWLFYSETLNDFTGSCTLTDDEIVKITASMIRIKEFCVKNGAELCIVVVPNKNEIYSENMPLYYKKNTEDGNIDMLLRSINEAGIDAPDLRTLFKGLPDLYYKTDTHWNAKGAAILSDYISRKYIEDNDFSYASSEPSHTDGFTGDLYKLMFPAARKPVKGFSDSSYFYAESPEYRYIDEPISLMDMEIETVSDSIKGGKLLMYRDSFGSELIPLLSGQFAHARYLRGNMPYDLSYIETDDPDLVVFVIAQRNIPQLLTSSFSGI